MKNIKTFESFHSFSIGDYVKCVNANTNVGAIKLNNIYEVEDVKPGNKYSDVKVIGFWWSGLRFVLATPEEIEEYKLQKSTIKYNL